MEGEKDCETLKAWALTATTNAQGAGKWRREYNDHFKGKRIVILPDNDDPGRKHAQDVARDLHGIAEIVKVVELPGLPHKGDVTNWINQGGIKEQLLDVIGHAPEWTPQAEEPGDDQVEGKATGIRVVSVAEFLNMDFPPRENLLSPILPTQGIVMVHALVTMGKRTFHLVSPLPLQAAGRSSMDGRETTRGIVFLDGEMPAIAIKERLSHAIINSEKEPTAPLHIVTPDLQEHGTMPNLSTVEGQLMLEPYLKDVSLVIVDNISTLCRERPGK